MTSSRDEITENYTEKSISSHTEKDNFVSVTKFSVIGEPDEKFDCMNRKTCRRFLFGQLLSVTEF